MMKKNSLGVIILTFALLLAVVVGACIGVLYSPSRPEFGSPLQANAQTADPSAAKAADPAQPAEAYSPDVVSGEGKLTAQGNTDVLTPAAVTIIQMSAKVGDEVAKGDVLARVDKEKLSTTLTELKAQLSGQERSVNQLSGARAESNVYSPVKGRIKRVYAEKEDDVQTVITREGALALLSTDGLMKVTFKPDSIENIATGAKVDVRSQSKNWEGRVASISEASKEITVTFTDNGPKLDETVTVSLGADIGSGPAQINAPLAITATGGTVTRRYDGDENNGYINKGGWLFTLGDVPISDNFTAALTKRQDLIDQINRCQTLLDSGEITAPESGIVEAVYNVTNMPLGKDSAILSLASNEKLDMVISVDELDIVHLNVGQKATATVTALGTTAYEGTVKKIASAGKIVGGIAMYDITIEMENAPGMRIAMSGTADIAVGE